MAKKVLVISTSLRKGGNSETLADSFLQGAQSAGNIAEKVSLCGKTINFCKGCLACQKIKKCVIADDVKDIIEKMKTADVIVFATPIYYYEMAGQIKTLLDRTNPLYGTEYSFRDIYLLSTAADDAEGTDARAITGLEGWIECFPQARLAGTVFAGGVTAVGEIKDHEALTKAYEMGKAV